MSFIVRPADTSLPREQEARIERMRAEPLFIIDTIEQVPERLFTIAVSGSTANLYTVTIDAATKPDKCMVSCSCPDGRMMAKFKRIKCKHACFVLLRLLRQSPDVLREGALNHSEAARPVLEAAQRACTVRNWESLTNREYQQEYLERLAAAQSPSSSSSSSSSSASSHLAVELSALEGECAICLEAHDKETRTEAAQCLVCRQAFHRACIDVWLACKQVRQCPLCRGSWSTYVSSAPPKKRPRSSQPTEYINLGRSD